MSDSENNIQKVNLFTQKMIRSLTALQLEGLLGDSEKVILRILPSVGKAFQRNLRVGANS